MYKIYLYGHGSSNNHGCEALVKSTINTLNDIGIKAQYTLISNDPSADKKWQIDEYVTTILKSPDASLGSRILAKGCNLLKIKNNFINNSIAKKTAKLIKDDDADLAISIGGDNYCYSKNFNHLFYKINQLLKKKKIKTIFWGCSISEEFIDNDMINDLKKYDLITVRETLTLESLKKHDVSCNVRLFPDSAFNLKNIETNIEIKNNTIGINISPMIIEYEKKDNVVFQNYKNLVYYILNETDYNIAFIPHVTINGGNDVEIIDKLYSSLENIDKSRITLINEMNSCQIKNVISKCKMFIGARTHSTIAAYSSCVPTLVVGYSVKAKGIAKDLFGKFENYVLPVQNLKKSDSLQEAFKWLDKNYSKIKNTLEKNIENYSKQIYKIKPLINNILEKK